VYPLAQSVDPEPGHLPYMPILVGSQVSGPVELLFPQYGFAEQHDEEEVHGVDVVHVEPVVQTPPLQVKPVWQSLSMPQ